MARHAMLMLLLLFFLVKVQCQEIPYVSFMGQTLASHSYVDISQVGSSGNNSVQCHTDLNTCCSGAQGPHRGDWYFPSGGRLPNSDGGDIYEVCTAQRVDLRLTTATRPSGIYSCDIETVAAHNFGMRETVYFGLYTSDRGKTHTE